MLKTLKIWFVGGVIAAPLFLLFAVVAPQLGYEQSVLTASTALWYDVGSIAHMLILARLAVRLDGADRRGAAGWLYTTGFLHTLIALGLTIAFAARAFSSAVEASNVIATALAPMGAAILPHFVGVLAGQLLELTPGTTGSRESSFLQQLTNDATAARQSLKGLYDERERALRDEIGAIRGHEAHWRTLSKELDALVVDVKTQAEDNRKAFIALATETRSGMGGVGRSVGTLASQLDKAGEKAGGLAEAIEDAVPDAQRVSAAFRDATGVVKDLQTLHASIVDLLSRDLFRR